MKNQGIKEGLIQSRVNKFANISQRIKSFINQKSINTYTPFKHLQQQPQHKRSQPKAKRSLTDWRQLYNKNSDKIQAKNNIYYSTNDQFRPRCSMTGQCRRSRKAYTVVKTNDINNGDRDLVTRQSKKSKNLDSKRQSIIQFALAQNCYENQILKDQKNLTSKEKKFYEKKKLNPTKFDIMKIGEYLSNISEFRDQQQLKQINATQKYINSMRDFQFVKMIPYNIAKIKDKYKINNSRYLKPHRAQSSENGLRFYERGI